jgi:hypothetical protein
MEEINDRFRKKRGAFRDAVKNIEPLRLVVCEQIASGKPLLGICLGLQLLFTESTEGGFYRGLDILKGKIMRFPEGLKPFRDKVHEKGMLWGLWMDAERVGDDSQVAKEHPEWISEAYDGQKRLGGMLNLAIPEAASWMETSTH